MAATIVPVARIEMFWMITRPYIFLDDWSLVVIGSVAFCAVVVRAVDLVVACILLLTSRLLLFYYCVCVDFALAVVWWLP